MPAEDQLGLHRVDRVRTDFTGFEPEALSARLAYRRERRSRADGCCGGGYRFSPACSATSVRAVDLFNLPPPNFLEIGRQIEI